MRVRDFEFCRDDHVKGAARFQSRGRRGHDALTGALACGVCCVLPFALPATVLATTGALLAWFAKIQVWAKILAVLSVVGAWGWIAWQSRRTRRKPAAERAN